MELFKSAAEPFGRVASSISKQSSSHALSQQCEMRGTPISGHKSARKPSICARSNSKPSFSITREPLSEETRFTNIRVFARFRPFNRIETELTKNGFGEMNTQFLSDTSVTLSDNSGSIYTFDKVLQPGSIQRQVFEATAAHTVQDVLNGYNGTIIAYGQTGSGKTYTMVGDAQSSSLKGIIPRSISEIFAHIARQDVEVEFKLTCSILEIYRENLYDLLSEHRDLKIKESPTRGVFVEGLTEFTITTERELYQALEVGEQTRRIASTRLNENSSRSHTLFILDVRQLLPNQSEKFGRLNLVDLAGSEKVAKTGAVGETLEEAKKINFSLSCLGNVIHALTNRNDYIPYRDSKLTRLLSESLGGNYRTSLIVTCSSHSSSLDETISTLKFATRAKHIKNTCRINVKNSPEEMQKIITQLRNQVIELKLQLEIGDRCVAIGAIDLEDPHEEAHQTVRNTSRLRMVKNPFQRGATLASITQPEPTNRESVSNRNDCNELSIESADVELLKQIAKLQCQLTNERLLCNSLREQLAESNRRCSFAYREEIKINTEAEKQRLQELCVQLENSISGSCSSFVKDRQNYQPTPRSCLSIKGDSLQLIIKSFPQDIQSYYEQLQDSLYEGVASCRSALEYIEAVKQTFPDHIGKYLQDCLSQQLDRGIRSQRLAESIVLKETIKHTLTSLELIQTRNNFTTVLEEAYFESLIRNEKLVQALSRALHQEKRPKGINLTDSHPCGMGMSSSDAVRLIESGIDTERSLVRAYEQNYNTLQAEVTKLKDAVRTLNSSISEHLAMKISSTPPPTMKNDCGSTPSPLRQECSRINQLQPKTPPREALACRSISLCNQPYDHPKHQSSGKAQQDSERRIQFRYQHYYA